MESSSTQLDLLKERIEYDENIFGELINYYGFVDNEENYLYTLEKNPKVGDMTYQYKDEEMVGYKNIQSISETEHTEGQKTYTTIDAITVDNVVYNSSDVVEEYCETYIKVLKRLLDDAKEDALSLRYPYQDTTDMELPRRYYNWQLRCAEELYALIGSVNIKSYSENGLNWTRDTANLSTFLVNKIEPLVGYIKDDENEDTE